MQTVIAFAVAMTVATLGSQRVWLWPTLRLRWTDEDEVETRSDQLVFSVSRPKTDFIVWDLAISRNRPSWLGRLLLRFSPTPLAGRLDIVLSDPDVLSLTIEAPDSPKYRAENDRWIIEIDDLRRTGFIASVQCGASLKHGLRPATVTVSHELRIIHPTRGAKNQHRLLIRSGIKEILVKKAAT